MINAERKLIAQAAAKAFGGQPRVFDFAYEFSNNDIALLESSDCPVDGMTSYATVGLSDFPLLNDGEEFEVRLELLGVCANDVSQFPNILASAAACIHHKGWFCAPGSIFQDVISEYYPDIEMRHVFFVPPFLWNDRPETLTLPSRKVAWLQAVPISHQEFNLAMSQGPKALEDVFEERQIDVYDINRRSVI